MASLKKQIIIEITNTIDAVGFLTPRNTEKPSMSFLKSGRTRVFLGMFMPCTWEDDREPS